MDYYEDVMVSIPRAEYVHLCRVIEDNKKHIEFLAEEDEKREEWLKNLEENVKNLKRQIKECAKVNNLKEKRIDQLSKMLEKAEEKPEIFKPRMSNVEKVLDTSLMETYEHEIRELSIENKNSIEENTLLREKVQNCEKKLKEADVVIESLKTVINDTGEEYPMVLENRDNFETWCKKHERLSQVSRPSIRSNATAAARENSNIITEELERIKTMIQIENADREALIRQIIKEAKQWKMPKNSKETQTATRTFTPSLQEIES